MSVTSTRRELIFNGGRVALGAVIATGLGASSVSLAAADDKVTIEFPYLWSGPEGEAMQKIVDGFNASQSAIEVKGVSNPDTQRQLAQMTCLLYTSPSPRDRQKSRMPSSA